MTEVLMKKGLLRSPAGASSLATGLSTEQQGLRGLCKKWHRLE
ncbi:hypothetical protein SAMN03159474_00462 [Pseudomonas sp. NFACC08-1]|nr:hypothetical protein SAMN03159474_00462 [Pseudomonas sp. NFACC08-1]SFM02418.1 hypothetical protein SAMN03159307_05460 [Pseudomonas sp. NFACC46-3]